MTHLPILGSPVLDLTAIGTRDCGTTITTDQRGDTRPQDSGGGSLCDAGAVESTSVFLPAELVSFSVVVTGASASLHWQTLSENNNTGFTIQHTPHVQEYNRRSNWQTLGFIEGHGTSTEAHTYRFTTEALPPGRHGFRLRQIDFDGSFTYSPELEVSIAVPEGYHLTPAYPNPFNPTTTFTLTVSQHQQAEVAVYNVHGQRVAHLHAGVLQAEQPYPFTFKAEELPSGIYFIRALGERFTASQQVLLVK